MVPRLITILLSLTLLVCGFFAFEWRNQWLAVQDERDALKSEREGLRRRIAELENAAKNVASQSPEASDAEGRESRRQGRSASAGDSNFSPVENWRGGGPARLMALMDKPETQRLLGIQQKAALDSRFASLFHSLNLSPSDLDRFKNLLVEKQTAAMDAVAAARAQGLTGPENRDTLRQVIASAQAEVDNTIRSTLGDAAFAQYQTYEQTLPERNLVMQLQQRLSYSAAPLTDAQTDQVIALLAANAPATAAGAGPANVPFFGATNPGFAPGQFRPGGGVPITDAVIAGSQGILNSTQIAALTQLQQEQQAQAQLAAQMRASRQAATAADSGPTAAPVHP